MIKQLIKIFSFAFIVSSLFALSISTCSCRGKKQSVSGWSDAPEWKAVATDTTRYFGINTIHSSISFDAKDTIPIKLKNGSSIWISRPGIGEGSGYASITRGGKATVTMPDGTIDTIEPPTPILHGGGWLDSGIVDTYTMLTISYDMDSAKNHLDYKRLLGLKIDSAEILEVSVRSYLTDQTYATRDTLGNWKINDAAKALEAFYQAYWNLRTK